MDELDQLCAEIDHKGDMKQWEAFKRLYPNLVSGHRRAAGRVRDAVVERLAVQAESEGLPETARWIRKHKKES